MQLQQLSLLYCKRRTRNPQATYKWKRDRFDLMNVVAFPVEATNGRRLCLDRETCQTWPCRHSRSSRILAKVILNLNLFTLWGLDSTCMNYKCSCAKTVCLGFTSRFNKKGNVLHSKHLQNAPKSPSHISAKLENMRLMPQERTILWGCRQLSQMTVHALALS